MPFGGTRKRIDHEREHCKQRKMLREWCVTGRRLVLKVDLRHKIVCISKDELIRGNGRGNKSVKSRIA